MANWVDYSDPKNYKDYTKEFGPKINVEGFGSNDEILAKLGRGGSSSTSSRRRVTRCRRSPTSGAHPLTTS